MTPDELTIVERDASAITGRTDQFSKVFYDTLFDLAPDTRRLFPDNMTAQRQKLADELLLLVDAAVARRVTGGWRASSDVHTNSGTGTPRTASRARCTTPSV